MMDRRPILFLCMFGMFYFANLTFSRVLNYKEERIKTCEKLGFNSSYCTPVQEAVIDEIYHERQEAENQRERADRAEEKAEKNLRLAESAEKDRMGLEESLKSLACAMDFRYAVESFNDRINKDASFSLDTVNTIMADLRQIIDDRNKILTHIVEHLSRASVLAKSQANLKVQITWLELQKMELDKSSLIQQHDLDLGKAIIRISEAKDAKAALKVWKEDKKTVWRRRIHIRQVRIQVTTVSSTTQLTTTTKSGSSTSQLLITPDRNKNLIKINPSTPQPTTIKKSTQRRKFKTHQEFLLFYTDRFIIRNLSNIPGGSVVENIINGWKYSDHPAAEYIRNIIYVLPYLAPSVTKQYQVCTWILFSHKFCSGIEKLIEFIRRHWISETWPKKVDRFCSRFDLLFWKIPSNKGLYPKFKLPPNCKLGQKDYNTFLTELGTLNEDAKIVAEGLFLHFTDNVTTSPAITTKNSES